MNTRINQLFSNIFARHVSAETYQWLSDKIFRSAENENNYQFNVTFTSMPRRTGKALISVSEAEANEMEHILPGFSLNGWTTDRLARVWLLAALDPTNKTSYIKRIQNLFPQAEMNEQVALYSALPFFSYPDDWKLQCAAGIRSNIDDVLTAIMYHNPYPAAYLNEPAWNQMIMKAFFTGKNINNITGVDGRANEKLAHMLFDYVEERWAAHRPEDRQIWRLTGKFLDEAHLYMMERLFQEKDEKARQAAALACSDSSLEKAKRLLAEHPDLGKAVQDEKLTWATIALDDINGNKIKEK